MILVVNTMIYLLLHVDFMILKISLLPENAVHVVAEALEIILIPVKCQPGHNQKILREAEVEREDGTNQWDLSQQRSETEWFNLNKLDLKFQTASNKPSSSNSIMQWILVKILT